MEINACVIKGFRLLRLRNVLGLSLLPVYFKIREDAVRGGGNDSIISECLLLKMDGKIYPISEEPIKFHET